MVSPSPSPEPTGTSYQATSLSLLDGAKRRDADAWRRLVAVYAPLVRYWCRRAALSEDDADEVSQETFAAVHRGLASFERRSAGDSFRGWLRIVVRNKLIDFARTRRDAVRAEGGTEAQARLNEVKDPFAAGDDTPAATETGLVFRAALDLLQAEFEPASWNAFWQTTVEERYPADVAQALGLSVNAVYKAKSRVLRRLREVLGGLEA